MGTNGSSVETKYDVRKTSTKSRGSSISNFVPCELQLSQRRIFAAKQTKTHLDNAHYQFKKVGWRGVGMNVHPQRQNETYARHVPSLEAPASPILLFWKSKWVRDVF